MLPTSPHEIIKHAEKYLSEKALEHIELLKQEVLDERFERVNRVRGGKVQRRKKVSTRDGYTFRNGKIVRMKASEKRKRKISQKKGARKRKGKMGRALRKRKISMRKRNRLAN